MVLSYLDLIFFTIVNIQLIYWMVWIVGLLKIKANKKSFEKHGVSVLIAAQNELDNLKTLIPLLLNQNYKLFEIIIVDDRSSDGSYLFLHHLSKKHSQLKILAVSELPLHVNGKKNAITVGIKSAMYDQILLTDADCKPVSRNWIRSLASLWDKKTSFVLGFSSYKKKPGLLNYFIRFETIITGIQYLAAAALNNVYMGVGRNLSYSKKMFLSQKGFHGFYNLMGGDDDIFVNKNGSSSNTKVILNTESRVISYPKTTLSDFIIQKTRHLSVGKYYSFKNKIMLGVFTITWALTWAILPFEILLTPNLLLLGTLVLTRFCFITATFFIFSNKSGEKFNLLGLVLLDFIFVLYYFIVGIRTLIIKRVKWS